ncbi:MAG: hypothetical protein PF636_09230 [Actinomycetota bacterium]|jgi:hypothetical protein|nr:hypothetical protein [Actinomycetota bacterium]
MKKLCSLSLVFALGAVLVVQLGCATTTQLGSPVLVGDRNWVMRGLEGGETVVVEGIDEGIDADGLSLTMRVPDPIAGYYLEHEIPIRIQPNGPGLWHHSESIGSWVRVSLEYRSGVFWLSSVDPIRPPDSVDPTMWWPHDNPFLPTEQEYSLWTESEDMDLLDSWLLIESDGSGSAVGRLSWSNVLGESGEMYLTSPGVVGDISIQQRLVVVFDRDTVLYEENGSESDPELRGLDDVDRLLSSLYRNRWVEIEFGPGPRVSMESDIRVPKARTITLLPRDHEIGK